MRAPGLAEATVPALVDGFRGKIPPKPAGDGSAQAGTVFWEGIGGNADMAASAGCQAPGAWRQEW